MRLIQPFLQCASFRFSALYFIPFSGGLAAAGALRMPTALLGAAFSCVLTLAIEVTNRLTDRVEDAINRPERTQLCAEVGWERLARLQTLLWCVVAASAAVWLAAAPGLLLAAVIALGLGAGLGYSHGPRFARRRLLALVVLAGTFVGPFSLGWLAGSPGAGAGGLLLMDQFVPLFTVMTLFIVCLAGIKDVTDRDGDAAIGYRGVLVALADRHGTHALIALAVLPYAALAAFAAGGALPARMLLLIGFLPISIAVALAVRGAGADRRRQMTVREAHYTQWLAFTSAALLACYPSVRLLAAVGAGWLFWILASRRAHWSDPLRAGDLREVARLARAGATPSAPSRRAAPGRERRAWGTS